MRLPPIPKRPRYRVDTATSFMMYATSIFFDLLQLVPKIFIILGMAAEVIPVFGQIVGTAAIGIGTAIDLVFGICISLMGYFTMWLWFQFRGVSVLDGNYIGRKALMFPATILMEMLPIINTFPSITFWTWYTIRISRKEDKEAHDTLVHKMQAEQEVTVRRLKQREAETAEIHARIEERQVLEQMAANDNRRPQVANDNIPQERRLAA